ncbi:MAG: hypothetical protein ACR2HX_19605 [Pyrinomonadaceae bacterium]
MPAAEEGAEAAPADQWAVGSRQTAGNTAGEVQRVNPDMKIF